MLKTVQIGKPVPRSVMILGQFSSGHVPSWQNLKSACIENLGIIAKEATRAMEVVVLNMLMSQNGARWYGRLGRTW